MTDITQPNALVLSPASNPFATPGSIQITADCGHKCWISVNAQHAMADDPDVETMCLTCFQRDADDDTQVGTLPGAAFELSAALGIPLDKVDEHIVRGIETLKEQGRAQRAK